MKYIRRGIAALCSCACLLSAAAALDLPGARLAYNGEAMSFAQGAQPVTYSGKAYVPLRAFFEAIGATVGYDKETNTITAVRGDITARFTVGQASATVAYPTETKTITNDAAVFALENVTYVPVRLATQAIGAAVGWDAQSGQVLIADITPIKAEYTDEFSLLNRYLRFVMPQDMQSIDADLSSVYTLHTTYGDVAVPIDGKIIGDCHTTGANVAFSVTADLSALEEMLAAHADAVDAKQVKFLRSLQKAYFQCIINRQEDSCYLRGLPLKHLGVPEGSYIKLPLDNVLRALTASKINSAVLDGVMQTDFTQCIAGMLSGQTLSSAAQTTQSAIRGAFEDACAIYGDAAFTQDGDSYVLSRSDMGGNGTFSRALTLEMQGDNVLRTQLELQRSDPTGDATISLSQKADGYSILSINAATNAYHLQLDFSVVRTAKVGTPILQP